MGGRKKAWVWVWARRSNADSFQVEREKIYTTKVTARVFQLSALIKMFSYINALRSTRQQAEHLSGRKCLGELESKHAHTANPTWYKNVKAPAKEFGLSYPNLFLAIEFVGMSQLQIIFQFLNFSISPFLLHWLYSVIWIIQNSLSNFILLYGLTSLPGPRPPSRRRPCSN